MAGWHRWRCCTIRWARCACSCLEGPDVPSTIPLNPGPTAGFDEPFAMLLACHGRVERMLRLLLRLDAHLEDAGADPAAKQAAGDVMRYFDLAGPAHHEDEERHVLPVLRSQGETALAARLHAEHEEMARRWQVVRTALLQVEAGTVPPAALRSEWQAFAALYRRHIAEEERSAFAPAQSACTPQVLRAMGEEMARRRGAPPPAQPAPG
ncbi:MAG: hemerythrin domain-containing protein [Burkholderiales bacterium]|nr:hemerythrin domain-containing protein [Burkholderiales bacterium]